MSKDSRHFNPAASWTFSRPGIGIHHLVLSQNNQEVCVSMWNGSVMILSSRTGKVGYTVQVGNENSVVTCSKFNPNNSDQLLSVTSAGKWGIYNYKSGIKQEGMYKSDAHLYTCDFSRKGDKYAIAGKDAIISIFDTKTGMKITDYTHDSPSEGHGHSHPIYALLYNKVENIIFSGSADATVLMWDTRTALPIRSFGGPAINGDTIDFRNDILLTGAWRQERPIELWDTRSGEVINYAEWGQNDTVNLYTCKFCQRTGEIVAGGAEYSSIKIFDKSMKPVQRLGVFNAAINSAVMSDDGNIVIASDQNGSTQAFFSSAVNQAN
ncbi:hypothetical protein TVAG_452100 [Trichomonas vaginalis G3]|uniref:Uncharacterized protein n=1 Tax=Trichomonas vaginalis (strain ATCC PRA-98 / G3) TaxID=412133 RepID=A2DJT2_TRIV3|nr:carbohydrate binding domain-containing protein family [Trichomonas vaginalis G3]EAY19296.1 hypothetical protein TVAG_452100 [Trichomonas vaginalis G3]KAI5527198.1 carbohydrate binding domain-containing protein family [Trichomonas vaginalis G3]|eukprot:XP_001580282.1 hypothetical protein [Trichomonas vaginalis G3]